MWVYSKQVCTRARSFLAQGILYEPFWLKYIRQSYKPKSEKLVSDKKIFKAFSCVGLCKTYDPWGRCHFLPQVYNLNNFGRCLLNKATNEISKTQTVWFLTRKCFIFSLMGLCKTWPLGQGFSDPRALILFLEDIHVYLAKLHTKYKLLGLLVLDQNMF